MHARELIDEFIGFSVGMMAFGFGSLMIIAAVWIITHWR